MAIDSETQSQQMDYARDLASLFPQQGCWSELEYLDLTDGSNRRIEYVNGKLEFLEMTTEIHEALVQFLFFRLHGFAAAGNQGLVYSSGIRLRVAEGRVRLPDVIFLDRKNFHARHNRVWEGADLVMEIVSEDAKVRRRDYEEKQIDYAAAGVAEYWIVDPQRKVVIVNRLADQKYRIHGEFQSGQQATSFLLDGFSIDVQKLFAIIEEIPE